MPKSNLTGYNLRFPAVVVKLLSVVLSQCGPLATLLWPGAVRPGDLHTNAVEPFACGDVQRFGVITPAKAAVGR